MFGSCLELGLCSTEGLFSPLRISQDFQEGVIHTHSSTHTLKHMHIAKQTKGHRKVKTNQQRYSMTHVQIQDFFVRCHIKWSSWSDSYFEGSKHKQIKHFIFLIPYCFSYCFSYCLKQKQKQKHFAASI